MLNNKFKPGDLVRHKKHVGIVRRVYKVLSVDDSILHVEGLVPQYIGLFEKAPAIVKNKETGAEYFESFGEPVAGCAGV